MRYRVLAPLMLHSGLLGLTLEQAQARAFGIVPEGALWRVVRPVGFKRGELIEHDGEISKAFAHAVESAEPVEPAEPSPVAAAKPAKRKP